MNYISATFARLTIQVVRVTLLIVLNYSIILIRFIYCNLEMTYNFIQNCLCSITFPHPSLLHQSRSPSSTPLRSNLSSKKFPCIIAVLSLPSKAAALQEVFDVGNSRKDKHELMYRADCLGVEKSTNDLAALMPPMLTDSFFFLFT